MRHFILIALFALLVSASYAQKVINCSFTTFSKEYTKLMALQPVKNYAVVISTTYYEKQTDPKPREKKSGNLKVFENDQYAYTEGSAIQIQEGAIRIDIDTVKKRILVSKANVFQDFLKQVSGLSDMDSTNYKITKTVTKQKIMYVVTEQKQVSQYQTIKMSFDVVTNHFLEMELLFWPNNYTSADLLDESMESPRVLMTYSTFKTGVTPAVLVEGEHLSDWCQQDQTGKFLCKKANYTLYDLRK